MKYKDYEDAFSAAWLNKYKSTCGGDALPSQRQAVPEVLWVLNIFEIVLRNAIYRH